MSDPTNEAYVSAATAWELSTKVHLGQFAEAEPIVSNFAAFAERLGVADLPITGGRALAAGGLSWAHRDPFDRMLAAQAIRENLVLLTKDEMFETVAGLTVRW